MCLVGSLEVWRSPKATSAMFQASTTQKIDNSKFLPITQTVSNNNVCSLFTPISLASGCFCVLLIDQFFVGFGEGKHTWKGSNHRVLVVRLKHSLRSLESALPASWNIDYLQFRSFLPCCAHRLTRRGPEITSNRSRGRKAEWICGAFGAFSCFAPKIRVLGFCIFHT